jgi:glycosyltransferase involved in cell wall biosynthesis
VRVLYFGTYERRYPRNAQVISALRGAGVEVVERHEPVWEGLEEKWSLGLGAALRLARAEARLLRKRGSRADAVIVGYPGHFDLVAARRAARGKPVILNPLVSLADTLVDDRGRFKPGSLPARVLRRIDRSAFRRADLVVADTNTHADFLAEATGVSRDRFRVCLVGAEERVFRPGWKPEEPFTALFVGKLIPLHGLETILEAARRAPKLRVRVAGSGQLGHLLAGRPANVEWVPWIDYERLPAELHRASCALGIFGTSAKAQRVIPNKAFHALACGVPLITTDTPAARELLADEETALLVPPGDPDSLAEALHRLTAEPETARRIAQAGHAVYRERASEEVLGRRWRAIVEEAA